MSTRPKSERMLSLPPSPPPPSNQRDAAIQELRRGSHLAAKLRQQLVLIPEVDRGEAEAANISEIAEAMESSLSILQSGKARHSSCSEVGAMDMASPASHSSDGSMGARHIAVPRARKVRHRGGTGLERRKETLTDAPENDRFHWRKYGEKNILNSEYPRLYYKCCYGDDHKCPAKKYV